MSLDWSDVSPTEGLDPIKDCPFSMVEIKAMKHQDVFNGLKTYEVILKGNAQQYTFKDHICLWLEDIRYYRACGLFDARRPLDQKRLDRFRSK
jgi:hypothetical protein